MLYLYLVVRDTTGNIANAIDRRRQSVGQRIPILLHEEYIQKAGTVEGTYTLAERGERHVESRPDELYPRDLAKLETLHEQLRENEQTIYDVAGRADRLELG